MGAQYGQKLRHSERERRPPDRYGFGPHPSGSTRNADPKPIGGAQALITQPPCTSLPINKDAIPQILASLRVDEEEESNERELIRSRMEVIERRGTQRQRLLEHLSILLTEQNNN